MKKTNKMLHIKECYFYLPSDFNGTLGESLTLLANQAIESEVRGKACKKYALDLYDHLVNSDVAHGVIEYEFIDVKRRIII